MVLTIKRASSLNIGDTERVQWYDLNKLRFRKEQSRIYVKTNIPLTLTVDVAELDVALSETDEAFSSAPS